LFPFRFLGQKGAKQGSQLSKEEFDDLVSTSISVASPGTVISLSNRGIRLDMGITSIYRAIRICQGCPDLIHYRAILSPKPATVNQAGEPLELISFSNRLIHILQ